MFFFSLCKKIPVSMKKANKNTSNATLIQISHNLEKKTFEV